MTTATMKLGLGRDKKGQFYFLMAYYSTEKVQVLKKKLTQCDDIRNWEFGGSHEICSVFKRDSQVSWDGSCGIHSATLWHDVMA